MLFYFFTDLFLKIHEETIIFKFVMKIILIYGRRKINNDTQKNMDNKTGKPQSLDLILRHNSCLKEEEVKTGKAEDDKEFRFYIVGEGES